LKLDDVVATYGFGRQKDLKKMGEDHEEVSRVVNDLVKRRGVLLLCSKCETSHNDATHMTEHINMHHKSELPSTLLEGSDQQERRQKETRLIRVIWTCVMSSCDPGLRIQQVRLVTKQLTKELKKVTEESHELDLFIKTADLIGGLIARRTSTGSQFWCRRCQRRVEQGVRGVQVHLTRLHTEQVGAWGRELGRQGTQLEELLSDGIKVLRGRSTGVDEKAL